ncbi:restriction endonuclease subunit S [Campylobacter sp. CX2-8023-23]|uniref:restriction endonuclease subunit S n=1 Tax=Campylobacter porcelli TaxID=1660073 RepID=UPI002EA5E788|nr:restriction endonuclease subunit S [Campylobacter sp. CX2-8023-23]
MNLVNGGVEREFKIGDLFDIRPTKNYGLTNNDLFKTNGTIPVIVNSSFNNGVGNYVNLEPTEKGNIVTFSDTTTSESIFYQPRDFIGYSHVQGVYPFSSNWREKTLLYFVAVFRKATLNRFDYANKFNRKIAKEINIKLPITANGEIDFDFMENFIKAIQKLIIKDLVIWSQKKIEATKQVVGL